MAEPFEIGRWFRHKVPPDYHVVIEGVAYSVPYRLIGKTVDVHRTASLISIFHKAERVASHARRVAKSATVRLAVSLDEHRPASHRAVMRLNPETVRATISAFGGAVAVLVERIFQDADHPEQAARQVAGLIRLGARYGTAALQDAAAAALMLSARPIAARFGPARTVYSRSFMAGEMLVLIDKKLKFDSFEVVC